MLTAEHLAALQAGKAIALDVMNEYLTFVVLDKPKIGGASFDLKGTEHDAR